MTIYIDHIKMLEAQEDFGVITRLVRLAVVKGIRALGTDYKVLIEALDDVVQKEGDTLDDQEQLILTKRSIKIVSEDTAEVELVYELKGNEGQDLNSSAIGEYETNVNQVTGNADIFGQVTVKHTYPADDPDYPNKVDEQGGEFSYMEPQKVFNIKGKITTSNPDNQLIYVGCINQDAWKGQPAYYWLCTSGTAKYLAEDIYLFNFKFQTQKGGWKPTVVYTDPRTGKPPVHTVGDIHDTYRAEVYPLANFAQLFGN